MRYSQRPFPTATNFELNARARSMTLYAWFDRLCNVYTRQSYDVTDTVGAVNGVCVNQNKPHSVVRYSMWLAMCCPKYIQYNIVCTSHESLVEYLLCVELNVFIANVRARVCVWPSASISVSYSWFTMNYTIESEHVAHWHIHHSISEISAANKYCIRNKNTHIEWVWFCFIVLNFFVHNS